MRVERRVGMWMSSRQSESGLGVGAWVDFFLEGEMRWMTIIWGFFRFVHKQKKRKKKSHERKGRNEKKRYLGKKRGRPKESR